jgi:hypothetical protein
MSLRLRGLACFVVLTALLCAVATVRGARAGPAAATLSNERTFTRWAHVASIQPIFRQPRSSSEQLARLHRNTEDGLPEVYLLLRDQFDEQGQEWVELRIPGRPNGRVGWVRREALGAMHVTHRLVIVDRARLTLTVYSFGRRLWSAPVGIGLARTPTPAGHFWIREVLRLAKSSSPYYPVAFGTAAYSHLTDWPGGGVVGIHGPYNDPQAIPGRVSHGCIRLLAADDAKLARYVAPGTPLLIR